MIQNKMSSASNNCCRSSEAGERELWELGVVLGRVQFHLGFEGWVGMYMQMWGKALNLIV